MSKPRLYAELLGWESRLGALEAGKLADVILVAGDPLSRPELLGQPESVRAVFISGVQVKGG